MCSQASASAVRMSGSPESDSTKKSKCSRCPVRCNDSYVARSPAKTRCTSSLQIGMTMAVRASSGIVASGVARREMTKRSPWKASSRKPVMAVQKPADTQQNSTANSTMMMASSQSAPWYGSTVLIAQVAAMVCAIISASSVRRRRAPTKRQMPFGSGESGASYGTGFWPPCIQRSMALRARQIGPSTHGHGTIERRAGVGPVSRWMRPWLSCSSGGAGSAEGSVDAALARVAP